MVHINLSPPHKKNDNNKKYLNLSKKKNDKSLYEKNILFNMHINYILTSTNELIIKPIYKTNQTTFDYEGLEYKINKKYIYKKKFLGFKTFFFSFYIQGNVNPISFSNIDLIPNVTEDVPINEIAILMRKIRKTVLDEILNFVTIINTILIIVVIALLNK